MQLSFQIQGMLFEKIHKYIPKLLLKSITNNRLCGKTESPICGKNIHRLLAISRFELFIVFLQIDRVPLVLFIILCLIQDIELHQDFATWHGKVVN